MSKSTFSVLLLIVGIAIFYFVVIPQWNGLQTTRADYAEANKAIEELRSLAAKRDELTQTYNAVSASALQKADSIIATDAQTSVLLVDLELLAKRNDLVLRSIDFGQPIQESGAKTSSGRVSTTRSAGTTKPDEPALSARRNAYVIPLTLRVSGRYDSFRNFLEDLELNQRILDVSSVGYAPSPKGQDDFNLQVRAYYQ